MKTPLGLVMVLLVVFIFSATLVPLLDFGLLVYYSNRTEGDLVASGWAAYSQYDYEAFASRKDIADREGRAIWLDETAAKAAVEAAIRQNMKLDSSNVPMAGSYLVKTGTAVSLAIDIINPDELPYTLANGKIINETAIHIRAALPVERKAPHVRTKDLYVMADTFLISRQK